jgi:hypothetical protein
MLFLEGLDLYERRLDKQYSLTDCISMHHAIDERRLKEWQARWDILGVF